MTMAKPELSGDLMVAELRARIAHLESQVKGYIAVAAAGQWGPELHAKIEECDLVKAALLWSLKNAAHLVGGEIITHLRGRYLERLNPPPEFAAVIGEVVEQITKGNGDD